MKRFLNKFRRRTPIRSSSKKSKRSSSRKSKRSSSRKSIKSSSRKSRRSSSRKSIKSSSSLIKSPIHSQMFWYDCENYDNCPKMIEKVEKINKNILNTMFVGCWGVYCKKGRSIERKYKKDKKKGIKKKEDDVEYGGGIASDLMGEYSNNKNIDCVILGGDNVYSTLIDSKPENEKELNEYKIKSHDILGQLKEGYINCYRKKIKTKKFLVGIGNHDIISCDILNEQMNFYKVDSKWNLFGLSYIYSYILNDDTKINLIFIDTNMYDESSQYCQGTYSSYHKDKQEEWLGKVLKENKKNWNIVIGHIPFICNLRKCSEDDDINGNIEDLTNNELLILLSKFHKYIDLYMSADEHNQQYIEYRDEDGVSINQVISGTGGSPLDTDLSCALKYKDIGGLIPGTQFFRSGFGFVGMDIDRDIINLNFNVDDSTRGETYFIDYVHHDDPLKYTIGRKRL
jgi:hypothetical protein